MELNSISGLIEQWEKIQGQGEDNSTHAPEPLFRVSFEAEQD